MAIITSSIVSAIAFLAGIAQSQTGTPLVEPQVVLQEYNYTGNGCAFSDTPPILHDEGVNSSVKAPHRIFSFNLANMNAYVTPGTGTMASKYCAISIKIQVTPGWRYGVQFGQNGPSFDGWLDIGPRVTFDHWLTYILGRNGRHVRISMLQGISTMILRCFKL